MVNMQKYMKAYYLKHKKEIQKYHHKHYLKNKQKYKVCSAKTRGLAFEILIPNPYENTNIKWEWHHINNNQVIAIPHNVHHAAQTNRITGITHRQKANEWIEMAYGICIMGV